MSPASTRFTSPRSPAASQAGAAAVKKFRAAPEPAYYFDPQWSPDSKRIVFHDNRLNIWLLDTTTGKLTTVGDKNVYGGFSDESYDLAWSPDSKWIAYPHSMPNHLHALYLYSVDTRQVDPGDRRVADSRLPAFDREGKYLYFTASTNAGATSDGLDMTSDLYEVTSNIYALVLAADQASPIAPELDDEKRRRKSGDARKAGEKPADAKEGGERRRQPGKRRSPSRRAAGQPRRKPPIKVDLAGIESRIGRPASAHRRLYGFGRRDPRQPVLLGQIRTPGRFDDRAATLSRWTLEDRKAEQAGRARGEIRTLRRRRKDAAGRVQPQTGCAGGCPARRPGHLGHRCRPMRPLKSGEGALH